MPNTDLFHTKILGLKKLGIYYGKDINDVPNYPPQGFVDDVKDFIRQIFFSERQRLKKEIKKMQQKYCDEEVSIGFKLFAKQVGRIEEVKGYNQALIDILKILE